MAKNNNNSKQQKRPSNPDPMSNPKTMGREGMRIIKNIAFGKYNIYTEGHIFRNPDFVNATIAEVDKKIMDYSIHLAAINYAYAGSNDPNVLNLRLRDSKSLEAYTLVKQTLESILMSGGDTGFLWILSSKLPYYKYNI